MTLNNPPKELICRVPLIFFIFNNQIPGFFEFFLIKNNKTGGGPQKDGINRVTRFIFKLYF